MAYTGPAITGIDLNNPGSTRSAPGINIQRLPGSNRSRDASLLLDPNNPSRALNEGTQKSQQIENFMSFFNKSVTPFLIQEQDRRAKKEAGEAIDAYPSILTASQDDPEAMDRLNALSPRAKDFAIEASMKSRIQTYEGLVNSATTANWSILTDPNDSEESQRQRALLRTKISSDAREKAFAGMPSYQLAINAEAISKAEKTIGTAVYTQRGQNIAVGLNQSLVQGGAAELANQAKNIMRPSGEGSPDSATKLKSLQELVSTTNEDLKAQLGSQDLADSWAQIIINASTYFPEAQERLQFLEMVIDLTDSEMLSASGKNIWTLPYKTKSGRSITIKSQLQAAAEQLEPRANRDKQDDMVARLNEIALDDLPDKAERTRQLLLSDPSVFKERGAVLAIMNQVERYEVRETDDMRQRSWEMTTKLLNGEDAQELWAKMSQEQIATNGRAYTQDAMRIVMNAAFGDKEKAQKGLDRFTQADNFLQEMKRNYEGAGYIRQGQSDYVNSLPRLPGNQVDPELLKTGANESPERREANNEYNLALNAEVKRLLDKDDGRDGQEILREAIKNVVEERRKQTNQLQKPQISAAQQGKQFEINSAAAIKEATARNNGKLTIPWSALAPETQQTITKQFSSKVEAIRWFKSQSVQKQGQWYKESLRTYMPIPKPGEEDKLKKQIDAEYKKIMRNATSSGSSQSNVPYVPTPQASLPNSSQYQSPLPRSVPITEQEQQESPPDPYVGRALALLDNASSGLLSGKGDEKFAMEAGRRWFNNNGQGPLALVTDMTGNLLSMALGGAPANASMLYSEPENIQALQEAFTGPERPVSSPQLPQMASETPVRMIKNAITSVNHEFFIAIGINEGTRTPSGDFTDNYYGHRDPGDGNLNVGTVSGGRGRAKTPEGVDREYMRILTEKQYQAAPILKSLGLQPGTVGYNRVMFNILDLEVQAPAAVPDFIRKLGDVKAQGFSIDAIAKARADAFFTPEGNLNAPGFNNNYSVLLKDQRSRAGAYDYKKRL